MHMCQPDELSEIVTRPYFLSGNTICFFNPSVAEYGAWLGKIATLQEMLASVSCSKEHDSILCLCKMRTYFALIKQVHQSMFASTTV